MDLAEAISARRSIRAYEHKPVDEAMIRRVIDAAVQAPSAINEQPWIFTVVRDQALLDRISHDAKAHMLATMSVDTGAGSQAERFRAMLSDPAFQIFYHAPVLILISARAPGAWIVQDCTLAAGNLMLTAHSLGIGSCWIGFAQPYLAGAAGSQVLGLPESWVPVAPIILGHPRAPAAPVARREPEIRWIG